MWSALRIEIRSSVLFHQPTVWNDRWSSTARKRINPPGLLGNWLIASTSSSTAIKKPSSESGFTLHVVTVHGRSSIHRLPSPPRPAAHAQLQTGPPLRIVGHWAALHQRGLLSAPPEESPLVVGFRLRSSVPYAPLVMAATGVSIPLGGTAAPVVAITARELVPRSDRVSRESWIRRYVASHRQFSSQATSGQGWMNRPGLMRV